MELWYSQQKHSLVTLSPRGRSGQSEERDICEFSSSGWINDVVEEGESRLGGGPQLVRVGGGLSWGKFLSAFCLSVKFKKNSPSRLNLKGMHLKAAREAKELVVM